METRAAQAHAPTEFSSNDGYSTNNQFRSMFPMSQQQQQQQPASYDLLAVFADEHKADEAATKLLKEGFSSEEVVRLASDYIRGGQFREHGPNRNRSAVFLQTKRSGPNPAKIVVFAIIFGIALGLILFLVHFASSAIPEIPTIIGGAIVGVILGGIVGFMQRGPVRGAIGQDMSKAAPNPAAMSKPVQGALTVVAVRFPDPENLPRKSRARAILLNNGGKIDRSLERET
jgi:hypothetical protein